MADQGVLELDHAIGYSGDIDNSTLLHPNRKEYLHITGAHIAIGSLSDAHSQSFLRGHDDLVTCLAVSSTGRLIASGQQGYNADVLVWDFDQRSVMHRFSEHDSCVAALDFSQDERLLVSCGDTTDGKMFVWDMATGSIVTSVPLTPNPTVTVKFGGYRKDIKGRPIDRYQFATAGNKKLVIWSLNPFTGELENEALSTGTTIRDVISIEFTPGGEKYMIAGTQSGDFLVFLMKNHHMFLVQPACSKGVTSICALSEEEIVFGGGDGTLSVFELKNNRALEMDRKQLAGGIKSLSSSDDGIELLVGTSAGYHYRMKAGDLEQYIILTQNHTKAVTAVAFPRGVSDKFATGAQDGFIKIWDGSDYSVITQCFVANAGAPLCIGLTLEIVISGWEDGKIRSFRSDNGDSLWTIDNAHRGGVTDLVLANNQRFIVSGGAEGEVRVWEIRTREMITNLKEHSTRLTQLALMNDDVHLITVSRDKSMLTWDLKLDKRVAAHSQRIGGINAIGLGWDSSIVVTAGQERSLSLWDLRQAAPIQAIEVNDEIQHIAVNSTGKICATGGESMIVRIWDMENLRILGEGHGHSAGINMVMFSNDDRQVISVGKDNCIMIWNIYL